MLKNRIEVVLKLELMRLVGDAKLKWMRWAKAMLGWRVIGAEVRGIWPRSAARQWVWWKAGKGKARTMLEKGKVQWAHGM